VADPAGADTIRAEAVLRSVLEIVTRNRGGRVIYTVQGTRAALLHTWPGTADHDAEWRLAEAIVERVSAGGPDGERVTCGIGTPRDGIDSAWESLRDSEIAARACVRVPRVGPIARYDGLGAYAVLMRLPDATLTADILPPSLRVLLAHDPNGTLTETLAAYLDHAGNSPRTAEALHIHRTSLYYRLGRIREMTGADLDDGATRLALQLGLAVLPLLGER
jgi:sugar diacid utilization regulator